jgi:DNA-binding response OmpR family regulator
VTTARKGDLNSCLDGIRVLLVEDTWHVAKALKTAIQQFGMHVSGPAATTADARRLLLSESPTIAVVDINLKRETACGLVDELYDRGVAVVVVSGYAEPPVPPSKVVAFLQKPFNANELLSALHTAVAKCRLH